MHDSDTLFRKDALSQLKADTKRYHVTDQKVRGLRLVVYPSGVKTFLLYRKVQGNPERIKIGRFPDLTIEQARNEAQRLTSLITLGQNPQKERVAQRKAISFEQLYEHYYTHHAVKFTKRPLANRKMMEHSVFPIIGKTKAVQLTTEQIRQFHTQLGSKYAGATANRLIAIVSAVFNFGIRESYIDVPNPCARLRKYRTVSRDRFLTFDELKSFWAALDEEPALFQDFFNLLLFTGARKSNVIAMQWGDINLEFKRWRIAEGQTKNKDVNIVPLSEPAINILIRRERLNKAADKPSVYVFPSTGLAGHLKDPKRAFERIRQRMQVPDIRMHDLRRTLGSYMAIGGSSLPIIGKALNHKSQVSTAIYARLSDNPVLEAVNKASNLMSNGF